MMKILYIKLYLLLETKFYKITKLYPIMVVELFQRLLEKTLSKEDFYQLVKEKDELIPDIIKGVSSSKATIRYSCAKVLMDLSKENPDKIYKYFDFFTNLLDSNYRILIWNAIITIANLTIVDRNKKFDKIFEKYFSLLNNDYMVTVANVVGSSSQIAYAKPYLINRISNELLKVDDLKITPHLTVECKRVIAEKTIISFDKFFDKIKDKNKVLSFARKHINSPRKTLKEQALQFLEKWD